MALQNAGLTSVTRTRDLDKLINKKNSCEFEMMSQTRSGVRIKLLYDYIYVSKKESGDPQYQKCIVNQIKDPLFHYMAIVGNNQEHENRLSEFDIDAVYLKNWDPVHYQDANLVDAERLELSASNQLIEQQEDGSYHPADLMAHKMQQQLEQDNRRALTFLEKEDD